MRDRRQCRSSEETPLLSVWKVECSGSGQMRRKGEGQLVCEA